MYDIIVLNYNFYNWEIMMIFILCNMEFYIDLFKINVKFKDFGDFIFNYKLICLYFL